jgi:hypothetical protein
MAKPAVRQFAGDIRFWEKSAEGALVPVIPEAADDSGNQPVETNSLTFGYEAGEEINIPSKRRGARYNQPIHNETLPGTTSVTATLLEVPPLILARMLFGEGSTAIVNAGSATAAEFTVPDNIDAPIQLPHRMLTDAAITITGPEATPAYVAGEDYIVDRRRGQLIIPPDSDIEAGDDLELTYAYGAHVATTIIGGATPTKSFYITGDMEDRISGENGELRIPEARLTTDGEVDWLSAEPLQVTLTGPVVVADGEEAPYTFVVYKAAA